MGLFVLKLIWMVLLCISVLLFCGCFFGSSGRFILKLLFCGVRCFIVVCMV